MRRFTTSSVKAKEAIRPVLRDHLRSVNNANLFESVNLGWGRVYGGQIVGQSLMAGAQLITNPNQFVNSIRTRFLGNADVNQPLKYEKQPLRLGKNFSWVSIPCTQTIGSESPSQIALSTVSIKTPSPGPRMQHDDSSSANLLGSFSPPDESEDVSSIILGVQIRRAKIINAKLDVRALWIRRSDYDVEYTNIEDQASLAYMSDYYFLRKAVERHGLDILGKDVRAASLCHSLFFHRPVKMNEWHLFLASAPFASSGRSLVDGQILNLKGERVATAVQEGLTWNRAGEKAKRIDSVKEKVTSNVAFQNTASSDNDLRALLSAPVTHGKAQLKEWGWNRVYGGELLGQAVMALHQAVRHEKDPFLHSLHGHFLQAGKTNDEQATFTTTPIRQGNIYTVADVAIRQRDALLFRADGSFVNSISATKTTQGSGIEHDEDTDDVGYCKRKFAETSPVDKADHGFRDFFFPHAFRLNFLGQMGLDFRQDFEPGSKTVRVFLKYNHRVDSNAMSQAIAVYASDCLFPPTVLMRHYPHLEMWKKDATVMCASLCSSLYFHRPFDIHEEWITMRVTSPIMVDSRALVKLDVFRDFGKQRVATFYQEVLVRDTNKHPKLP